MEGETSMKYVYHNSLRLKQRRGKVPTVRMFVVKIEYERVDRNQVHQFVYKVPKRVQITISHHKPSDHLCTHDAT